VIAIFNHYTLSLDKVLVIFNLRILAAPVKLGTYERNESK